MNNHSKKGHNDPQPEHGKDNVNGHKNQKGRDRVPGKSHSILNVCIDDIWMKIYMND